MNNAESEHQQFHFLEITDLNQAERFLHLRSLKSDTITYHQRCRADEEFLKIFKISKERIAEKSGELSHEDEHLDVNYKPHFRILWELTALLEKQELPKGSNTTMIQLEEIPNSYKDQKTLFSEQITEARADELIQKMVNQSTAKIQLENRKLKMVDTLTEIASKLQKLEVKQLNLGPIVRNLTEADTRQELFQSLAKFLWIKPSEFGKLGKDTGVVEQYALKCKLAMMTEILERFVPNRSGKEDTVTQFCQYQEASFFRKLEKEIALSHKEEARLQKEKEKEEIDKGQDESVLDAPTPTQTTQTTDYESQVAGIKNPGGDARQQPKV